MDLGGGMGYEQAQNLPFLEPGADAVAAALAGGVLPANHLVFFLLDLAAELDLSAIYALYEARDPRGFKAYEPRMMVVLLLYVYCVGIPSSRRIEKACWEDAAFRVLTGNQQPDQGFPPRSSRCVSGPVCAGVAAVPEGGPGEPGQRGSGWHQGQNQCLQTQGHEPRADAQNRGPAGSRDRSTAAQG
jgi:hypothetical protein